MQVFELSGQVRTDLGKKATKAVRQAGLIPCVIYGNGVPVHFTVTDGDVRKLIYTPNVYIVNLTVADKSVKCIIKELQFHPVSDKLLHMDFYEITEDRPVSIEIPVKLVGLAEGVKLGGKLQQSVRKLLVNGIYTNFPDVLEVDVTSLQIGKSIQVGALSYDNLELLNNPSNIVATVKATRGSKTNV